MPIVPKELSPTALTKALNGATLVRTMCAQKIKLTVTSEDLLTIRQAAKELGVHLATAYRWVEKGKLNAFRIGGQVFVTVDQVRGLREKTQTNEGLQPAEEEG